MFEHVKQQAAYHEEENKYAVLLPYLPHEKAFLFEVRSVNLQHQPGEVCFPGGKVEQNETPAMAAVRETAEELLLPEKQIQIVTSLHRYTTVWGAVIYPFLGELENYEGLFSEDEVQEVFTVPFDFFLQTEPEVQYMQVNRVPENPLRMQTLLGTNAYNWARPKEELLFYEYQGKVIWGMTAKMMYRFVQAYKK